MRRQDLIMQLEKSQHQLQQLRLDCERDQQHLRDCRQREDTLLDSETTMRSLLDRNAYVTVLLDGDSLIFNKDLWLQGEKGGVEAAQLMKQLINDFAKEQLHHLPEMVIHAKLFLNTRTIGDALARLKPNDRPVSVDSFLRGFLNADSSFDLVDTSFLKQSSAQKIKESYRHDFVNVHCHQIFLGVLGSEEFNALFEEYPDIRATERVTILDLKNMGRKERLGNDIDPDATEFKRVSAGELLVRLQAEPIFKQTPVAKIATPILTRIESNSSSKTINSGPGLSSITSTPILTWAAMTAQPFIPKPGEVRSGSSTPLTKTPLLAKSIPVASIPRNKHGQRVDPVDDSIPYQELQRIKKMKLCNIFYLQGKNYCDGSCNHSHIYPLKSHEKSILKEVARMTPCYYKTECDDPGCIYGHRCPQNKPDKKDCYYQSDCRFVGWGHGIDTKVVKTQQIR